MSSDTILSLEGLESRVLGVRETATRLAALRDQLATDVMELESEVARLSLRIEVLSKVGELFRALMDKLVVKQVQAVETVVTEGLGSIFSDLDLAFEAEVGPKYNKISVDFFLRQGPAGDTFGIRGKPLEAFGGGPSTVADLILRLLTLLRLKKKPLLFLDETLAAVSDEYTDQTGRFLKQITSSMGVDLLLVTHKPSYLEHADRSYRCVETVDGDSRRLQLKGV